MMISWLAFHVFIRSSKVVLWKCSAVVVHPPYFRLGSVMRCVCVCIAMISDPECWFIMQSEALGRRP